MTAATLLLAVAATTFLPDPRADESPVASFRLQDHLGAWHALDDVKEKKLVVIAFVGVDCPLANLYAPRLAELSQRFEPKDVAFFAVDANQQDAPSALASFVKEHRLPFPLLKDLGNELADRLGAERTPEVFVLDQDRKVRYHGRIDDQFGLGYHRPQPNERDLEAALTDMLADRPVATPQTQAAGCRIGRIRQPHEQSPVTYSKQVARILKDRCVSCHRAGEIAPFSLTSYKQAAGWAETIAEVVADRRMPPWHASPEFGSFQNDARLTDDERTQIADWVAAGAPEGDRRDLPEPSQYVDGWRIPKPDLIFEMPEEVEVPADGSIPYRYFAVNPKLDHDTWIQASQVRPGNPSVVHHLVVFVLPPGSKGLASPGTDFLAAYSPGMPPRNAPEGLAKVIPAGSLLLFQVHYTPKGTPQKDRSRVGLVLADPKTVRRRMVSQPVMNGDIRIPPQAADYQAQAVQRFDQDMILYSMLPHMHLRGKSFRFEVTYPDGRQEVLLDVPRYEFDWQNVYVPNTPKLMPEGTVMRCQAHFDNSAQNASNPDPAATVTFGEQTNDEMLVGYLDVGLAEQDLAVGEPESRLLSNGRSEVTFHYRPAAASASVYLAGTFNDWKPTDLKMDGPDDAGAFITKLELPAGTHEYKFVIDGKKWRQDPGNRRQVGFYNNSVLVLGKPPKTDLPQ
ncbi:MAG TPA: redoxin domain-containing protein [Isosphaeraceae bacterium]|nr:redoxin domain-containing protein [Isosphaeraceae bacterium]